MFFGRETIEVATFRASSAPSQGEEPMPDADAEKEVEASRRLAEEPVVEAGVCRPQT